jgi:protein-S-isoprenylcysteine O-methyltransferase Ste14
MEYVIAFAAGLAAMFVIPRIGRRRRAHAESRPQAEQHRGPVAIWALGCVLTGLLAVMVRGAFG